MKTPQERITRRRSFVPAKYLKLFDRCIAGTASPREAIRVQCLECWGYVRMEAETCDNICCPLFQYNPLRRPAKSPAGAVGGPNSDDLRRGIVQRGGHE